MLWRSTGLRRPPPGFIEPCLPTILHSVPSGPQWVHEIKHGGYRFIYRRDGDKVRVFSRPGSDYTDRVPAIADALAALRVKSVTLDGEVVVCDPDGVTDLLCAALGRKGSRRAFLCAFDLLELDGRDLRQSVG
jgi:bifunctional non-homologous end joining protein LigD